MTAKALRDLILWLRSEGIAYSSLTAGDITLDGVIDTKAGAQAPQKPVPDRPSMYERYGADLLRQPLASKGEQMPDEAIQDD